VSGRRIERRARPKIVDDALERLDLRGQFAGGGAVTPVLDLQQRVRVPQPIDLGRCTPAGPEADKDGHHHHAANRRDRGAQIDRHASKDAR